MSNEDRSGSPSIDQIPVGVADDENVADKLNSIPAPLLYEVNELLEKERILQELQLLDQEITANEWKEKYEKLKETVVDGVLAKRPEDYLESMDQLGDLEEEPTDRETRNLTSKLLATKNDFNAILLTRVNDNCADLSDLELSPRLFGQLVKEVFGVRSDYDLVTVLDLQNSGTNNSKLLMLIHAIRNPRLLGLNLSKNDVDEAMLNDMLGALRVSVVVVVVVVVKQLSFFVLVFVFVNRIER
jgi:hypothetical protein